jgi:hypothetical protein
MTQQSFFVSPADADAAFSLVHSAGTAQPHHAGNRETASRQHNIVLDQLSSPIGF